MYKVGVDLGGTNIVAAVVNEKFEIVYALLICSVFLLFSLKIFSASL